MTAESRCIYARTYKNQVPKFHVPFVDIRKNYPFTYLRELYICKRLYRRRFGFRVRYRTKAIFMLGNSALPKNAPILKRFSDEDWSML